MPESLVSSGLFNEVVPEKDRIDIVADDLALEVKTINTNYKCNLTERKNRPVTKNLESLINDIRKLKKLGGYRLKAIFCIVFPLPESCLERWRRDHLEKICSELRSSDNIQCHQFTFKNGIPGIMYFIQVK